MRSKVIACALAASLGMIADIRGAGPRFYPDDPIAVDHDRLIDVTTAHKIDLDDGINPIVNATLSPAGELRFENAAVQSDVGGRPEGYALRWSRFDNTTDTHAVVGDDVVVSDTGAVAPSGVLKGSDYISVRIDTHHPRYPTWVPLQVYFRRTGVGWQTVGLDRGLEETETSARRTSGSPRHAVAGGS